MCFHSRTDGKKAGGSFAASAQGVIEVNDALYLVKSIVGLCQFSLEQGLAGREHFEVGSRSAVLHQLLRAADSLVQGVELFRVDDKAAAGGLPLREGIVHLVACPEQALAEGEQGLFLACLGDTQVGMFCPRWKRGCVSEPRALSSQLPGLMMAEPLLFVHPAEPLSVMRG